MTMKNAPLGQFLDPYRRRMTANTLKSTWNFAPIFRVGRTKFDTFRLFAPHPSLFIGTAASLGCSLNGRANGGGAQSTFSEPYFGAQFDCGTHCGCPLVDGEAQIHLASSSFTCRNYRWLSSDEFSQWFLYLPSASGTGTENSGKESFDGFRASSKQNLWDSGDSSWSRRGEWRRTGKESLNNNNWPTFQLYHHLKWDPQKWRTLGFVILLTKCEICSYGLLLLLFLVWSVTHRRIRDWDLISWFSKKMQQEIVSSCCYGKYFQLNLFEDVFIQRFYTYWIIGN